MIKVSIVDDEDLFVGGLEILLNSHKNINVTVVAYSGQELLDNLISIPIEKFPDIILVDIQMKPMNGFELVEKLKELYSDLRIVIISSHYKKNILGHMIKLGVSAFIPKIANKTILINTIESVFEFGVYFTQKDQQLLLSYMNNKSKKPVLNSYEALSEREIEVLKLICQELTNQEIADKLFLSKRTIESHRQRILDKIGAKNTVGLVVYAIMHEIHPIPKFTFSV